MKYSILNSFLRTRLFKNLTESLKIGRVGKSSIIAKITRWYIFSAFILVFVSTGYLYWSLKQALLGQNKAILLDRMDTISSLLQQSENPIQAIEARILSEWSLWQFEQLAVRVVDIHGKSLVESPKIPSEVIEEVWPKSTMSHIKLNRELITNVKTQSDHSYLALSKWTQTPIADLGEVIVYLSLEINSENLLLKHYLNRLVLVLAITFLLSAIIGRRLAAAGFKPVQNMIDSANRVHSSTLHERVEVEKLPKELKGLARTINEMLNRLENSFERLTRFSSDIAHELRTPINNLRGEIEVSLGKKRTQEDYQEILHSSLEEISRLSRIIDSLLFLAQAENPNVQIRRERILLDKEINNILEFYEPSASEENIRLNLESPKSVYLNVEKTLFQRALGNVLSNALNHTQKNGEIHVQVKPIGENVVIQITDTGCGIAKEHLPNLFDRFYRADPSRTANKLGGFGLGLSIVKVIVKMHGGTIDIQSEKDRGTTVQLIFPS